MDSITSLYDDIESTSILIKERYLKEIIDLIDSNKRIHLYGEGISLKKSYYIILKIVVRKLYQ